MNYSHLTLCLIYSTSTTMVITSITTTAMKKITATTLAEMTPASFVLVSIENTAAMRKNLFFLDIAHDL